MLEKEKALKIISHNRVKAGPRYTYTFKCSNPSCTQTITARSDSLKTHSGYCAMHSHQKRPFESIYNGLFNDHRKTAIKLTYEEFLTFTNVNECHYCGDTVTWIQYGTEKGKYKSRAYYLDRIDNNGPYSIDNCVVCCTTCNRVRKAMDYTSFINLCKKIANRH